MATRDWTIPGAAGQPLIGTTHLPPAGVRPVAHLLICHGFKGYKDYGLFPALATACAKHGIVAHRFNFSHSGMTQNVERFERPDLFEQDRWSYQIADLLAVHQHILDDANTADAALPIIWFGHSRGGVTVLLTASEARDSNPRRSPTGLITAASPDTTCSLTDDQRAEMHEAGRLPSPSSRTGQMLYVGEAWLQEIEVDPQRFDLLRAASRVRCPLLVLHGEDDTTVPVAAADRIASAAGQHARLLRIAGASHTFNASNPLPPDAALPPATAQLIGAVCAFTLDIARHA
jgi:pimeloyl-ACP methyl ester carboxylesterase